MCVCSRACVQSTKRPFCLLQDLLEVEFSLSEVANAIPLVTTAVASSDNITALLTHPADTESLLCSNLALTNDIHFVLLSLFEGKSPTDQLSSESLSGEIYRHYNPDTCQWHFSLWFPLRVVLDTCGAVLSASPYQLTLPLQVAFVTITDNALEIVRRRNVTVTFSSSASLHSAVGVYPFTYHPTSNHYDAFLQLMAVDLDPNSGNGGGARANMALYSHAKFNGSFVSGTITQPLSSQDCGESHPAMPVYSELTEQKAAKQAWLLPACIGNLSSSAVLLVSLKACFYYEDHRCTREEIYTFELPFSLGTSSTEPLIVRASLQFKSKLVKSSQLYDTNLRSNLAG